MRLFKNVNTSRANANLMMISHFSKLRCTSHVTYKLDLSCTLSQELMGDEHRQISNNKMATAITVDSAQLLQLSLNGAALDSVGLSP